MVKKCIQWLYEEIPGLVEKGVLSQEGAQKIQEHYGEVKGRGGRQIAIIVFGVLASLLIGLGIILLFAHNWNELSRPAKTALSLAPLIIGQVLVGTTIWRKYDSIAWREGSSTFLMISIGASMALISQTYHITGDFGVYMLTWMLLSIPLVYLLNATTPLLLYLVGIISWAGYARFNDAHPVFYWILAALIIPYLWRSMKEDRYGFRPVLILWIFSISLCIATGYALGQLASDFMIISYSFILPVMFLIGAIWFDETENERKKPLQAIAGLGTFVLGFIFSYRGFWESLDRSIQWKYHEISRIDSVAEIILSSLLLALFVYAVIKILKGRRQFKWLFIIFPVLAIYSYFTARGEGYILPALLLFNFYLIAFGLVVLITGLKETKLSAVNAGMLLIIMVIAARFFDTELTFLVRGLSFIIFGICLLFVNLVLHKRWKGGA